VIVLIFSIVSSNNQSTTITSETDFFHTSALVNLSIEFGNGTIVNFSDANGTNVLEATESKVDMVVEWYGDLAYVVEIEGVHNDGGSGLYWQYWVNGDRAPFAANKMPVSSNDLIEWRRTTSSATDTATNTTINQFDIGLVVGTSVTITLGPLFLGILQIIKKRRLIHES